MVPRGLNPLHPALYAAWKRRSPTALRVLQAFDLPLHYLRESFSALHDFPRPLGLLGGLALEGALEGEVEGGLGFLVFLRRNVALLAVDFELEEFFF